MTYYTTALIFIFLLSILIFKLWKYLRNNLLLQHKILENLEKIYKENGAQQTNLSGISAQLLTIVHCLNMTAENTLRDNKN